MIHETYLENLFKKDETSSFRLNNQSIDGIIRDVNEAGNLIVEIDEKRKEFKHKEIELLF